MCTHGSIETTTSASRYASDSAFEHRRANGCPGDMPDSSIGDSGHRSCTSNTSLALQRRASRRATQMSIGYVLEAITTSGFISRAMRSESRHTWLRNSQMLRTRPRPLPS